MIDVSDNEQLLDKKDRECIVNELWYDLKCFAIDGERISLKAFSILDDIESYDVNVDELRDSLKEKILEKVNENIGFDVIEYIENLIDLCNEIVDDFDCNASRRDSVENLESVLSELKELLEDIDGIYPSYNKYILSLDLPRKFEQARYKIKEKLTPNEKWSAIYDNVDIDEFNKTLNRTLAKYTIDKDKR